MLLRYSSLTFRARIKQIISFQAMDDHRETDVIQTRHMSKSHTSDGVNARSYPKHPRAAVSAVIIDPFSRPGTPLVVLVQRGKEPMKGTWSLPGGAIDLGETVVDAAVREVEEECGLTLNEYRIHPHAFHVSDAIFPSDDELNPKFHYVIAQCAGQVKDAHSATKIVAGDDAAAVAWYSLDEVVAVEQHQEYGSVSQVFARALAMIDVGLLFEK
eukprot:m.32794 g.32794  ORF g.32794 m.32794 type:complete len:214 (+) comp16697_c0_seq1:181-822(+)